MLTRNRAGLPAVLGPEEDLLPLLPIATEKVQGKGSQQRRLAILLRYPDACSAEPPYPSLPVVRPPHPPEEAHHHVPRPRHQLQWLTRPVAFVQLAVAFDPVHRELSPFLVEATASSGRSFVGGIAYPGVSLVVAMHS